MREVLAWEASTVSEDECHIGLLQYPVVDKVLSLRNSDNLSQEVSEPDGVDEVEVVQASEVVVVVEEDTVIMEELGSWEGGREGGRERERRREGGRHIIPHSEDPPPSPSPHRYQEIAPQDLLCQTQVYDQ